MSHSENRFHAGLLCWVLSSKLLLLDCFPAPRLGRHGKIFLTIPSQSSTDEQKFIQKGEAPGADSLFDLDPEDLVFFVGGFPPDVKVINVPRGAQKSHFF